MAGSMAVEKGDFVFTYGADCYGRAWFAERGIGIYGCLVGDVFSEDVTEACSTYNADEILSHFYPFLFVFGLL